MKKKPKLSLEERERIFGWLYQSKSCREIAALLDRSHTTISREIARNKNQNTGEYLPCKADKKARSRERFQRQKAPLKDLVIMMYVRRKLRQHFSPECIAGRLPIDHPGKSICIETIYQYIYNKRKHPKQDFTQYLVLHRKKRMKKHGRKVKRTKIPDRIGIEMRPDVVENRSEYGHGETDLLEGIRSDKQVLSVTIERKTRFVNLTLIPNKTAAVKTNAVNNDIIKLSLLTMTTDNGPENTDHKNWNTPVYFTNPYSSWEKGGVENTIGRTRRYVPKKQSIQNLTQEEVDYIQWEMNNTPRKCLNWLTPAECLEVELQHVKST